jgi:anti-sigma B factor antagonist
MAKLAVSAGNPVVGLSGEIDMATVEAMLAALRPWLQAGGPVTLDVSEVTFMDSTGLHAVVRSAEALGGRGCIIVHGAHGVLAKVLQLMDLDGTIENLHFVECTVLAPAA